MSDLAYDTMVTDALVPTIYDTDEPLAETPADARRLFFASIVAARSLAAPPTQPHSRVGHNARPDSRAIAGHRPDPAPHAPPCPGVARAGTSS